MKALVTGANGHLGFNLCAALLECKDVAVRASVRDRADEAKVEPLRTLGGLEIVELDIRDRHQFDAGAVLVRLQAMLRGADGGGLPEAANP